MNFELTEDQKMIRQSVKDFVKKELPLERMRKMREDELGMSRQVWKQMGELGWLGIAYPEALGGFGGRFVDASLVLEQLGRALVHEPYLESTVAAGRVVLELGSEAQKSEILGPMIAGDEVLSLAFLEEASRFGAEPCATTATKVDGGWRVVGDKRWVLAGNAADQLIVTARSGDGLLAFAVRADADGVGKKTVKTMDGRRAAMIHFDTLVADDRRLGEPGAAAAAVEKAFDYAAAGAVSEGYGVIKSALDMTVEYLKTREQFGVKIGSFQVLQHRAVDMFIESQLAQSVAIMSAIKVDDEDPEVRRRSVSAAKAQLALSGKYVSQQATQLHGGIGVTEEHDITLFFKRMHALNTLWGDETFHVQRFASLPSFAA
ncbi:MAG: acyl-CoA dehydrogenase family protein [Polyangiaceae bacterium]